jgi:hypothetical protein
MSGAAQPYAPTLSTGASSPASSTEPFDYTTAIDPALEGTIAPPVQIPAPSYDGGGDYKQGLENVNSFPQTAPHQSNHKGEDPLYLFRHRVFPVRGCHGWTLLTQFSSKADKDR